MNKDDEARIREIVAEEVSAAMDKAEAERVNRVIEDARRLSHHEQ